MNSAVSLNPGLSTRWTIVSGSMQGNVRLMNQAQFTVGRNSECEFVITDDPKCSRRQAGIRVSGRGCEITSLNDKNPCLVNGAEVEHGILNEGDIVTFGGTEVQFSLNAGPQNFAPQIAAPAQASMQTYDYNYQAEAPAQQPRGPRPKPVAKRNNTGYMVIGIVVLVGYFVFSGGVKKKADFGLRNEQQMTAEIESTKKITEARENENSKRLDPSINARQAQENYVRGFRDYRKGQFERSTSAFQACLALDPGHVLCNRYLRLSQRKFNEMIQYYVLLGRKYREQNQFASCRSAFRNVMVMVKDANNETYKLAKANYEACNAFVEGRF